VDEAAALPRTSGPSEFASLRPSKGDLPLRAGGVDGPSLSGCAPEGMFDRLVSRRVLPKAQKRQTHAGEGSELEVMFVDVSAVPPRNTDA
jgi:hypothetical protein